MKLKSFGCSFTYGSELSDMLDIGCPRVPSQFSWPALIARDLGFEYECFAKPGVGNLQILEQVLGQVSSSEDSVFVINWSYIDRFDWTTQRDEWRTICPADLTPQAESFYKYIHSQFRDKFTSLVYVDHALHAIQQKKIPVLMTCIDSLLFETQWHTNPVIGMLQSRIRDHITDFCGLGFLDWARSRNFQISNKNHPLNTAHKAAAKIMLPCVQKIANRE